MKIGLIGAENSHAEHFCQVINRDKKHPGFTITHIYGGDDTAACDRLCATYNLTCCDSEEAVIAACDALVITYRKGDQHYAPSMKVLKAGKPLFNDKPFTTDYAQAQEIVNYAKENNILLCGGSSTKDLADLSKVKEKITKGSTVVISHSADPDSIYNGFWFYGIHCAETCLKLLGCDFKAVTAFRNGNGVTTSVAYEDKHCVIVNSPDATKLVVSIINADGAETIYVTMDYQSIGPDQFVKMLATGEPPYEYGFYAKAVDLMSQIMKAAELCGNPS